MVRSAGDQEYFNGRKTGLKTLGGIVDEVDHKYSISVAPGPAGPMWKMRRQAEAATVAVVTCDRFAEREPDVA